MCTLILLRRPGHDWPVIIGANRDEMIDAAVAGSRRATGPTGPRSSPGATSSPAARGSASTITASPPACSTGTARSGPAPGQRSRGELVLEALDHADARAAAEALAALEPSAYRTFNLIVADNRDAFWLRHADPSGTLPVSVTPIGEGLPMIAAGDLDDRDAAARAYRPLFAAAPPPDPDARRLGGLGAAAARRGHRRAGRSRRARCASSPGAATARCRAR